VDIYRDAFKDYRLTKIAINVSSEWVSGTAAEAYLAQAALDRAFEAGFAIRFDGAGDGFDIRRHVMQTVIDRYFPASPVYAETWYGWAYPQHSLEGGYDCFMQIRSNSANFGFYRQSDIERALAYDPDFFVKGLRPNANGVQLGYRILPVSIECNREVAVGGEIRFSSKWQNTGVGVLYRHYPLKFSLTTASGREVYSSVCEDFDITRLVKGETYNYETSFRLPDGIAPGTYKVRIALADKNNNNNSAIKMPIGSAVNNTADYVIGNIKIL
jgi:hypothetical protein